MVYLHHGLIYPSLIWLLIYTRWITKYKINIITVKKNVFEITKMWYVSIWIGTFSFQHLLDSVVMFPVAITQWNENINWSLIKKNVYHYIAQFEDYNFPIVFAITLTVFLKFYKIDVFHRKLTKAVIVSFLVFPRGKVHWSEL